MIQYADLICGILCLLEIGICFLTLHYWEKDKQKYEKEIAELEDELENEKKLNDDLIRESQSYKPYFQVKEVPYKTVTLKCARGISYDDIYSFSSHFFSNELAQQIVDKGLMTLKHYDDDYMRLHKFEATLKVVVPEEVYDEITSENV